jgi:hypothetical protein
MGTREKVHVTLAKAITPEAEQHRGSHLQHVTDVIRRMFPVAHISADTPTAEHDTLKVHGVVRWSAEQVARLAQIADDVQVDCLSGAATMYINKTSGYLHAAPSKSSMCLDTALCIFMLALLWTCMHCIFPDWLWTVPSSVESMLSMVDINGN